MAASRLDPPARALPPDAPAAASEAVPAQSRRGWIAAALCVAPLAVLAAVVLLQIPVSQVLLWALILLCPLSHLLHGHGQSRPGAHDHHRGMDAGAPTGRR